jgi:signal-transduction protein with cAMP-binding, CBS, and nucleotidyltransferase domain
LPRTKSEPEKIGVKTKDLMEVPPVTVMESATIDEAAAVMWDQNIGSVIVVNQAGVMAGILTERDVLYAVTKSLTSRGVPVSSVMSKTSLIASPNEGVLTAVERMLKSGVRHLPVVDKEGTPVGMISMRDAIDLSEPLLKMVLGTVHRKKTTTASPKP